MTTAPVIQPVTLNIIPKIPPEIKELIEIIPEYDGSTGTLPYFINTCDEIVGIINKQNLSNIVKRIILHTIRKKVVRDTNIKTATKTYLDWESLKDLLVEEYGDKRNEVNFFTELSHLEQKQNEDIFCYFDKYEDIYNRLISLLKLKFSNSSENVVIFMSSYASHNFIINCREPYRSQLAARNLKSLNDIQNLIKNDFQYIHTNIHKQNTIKPKINAPTPVYKNITQNQYRSPMLRYPQQQQNFPSQPIHPKPRINNYSQPMSISTYSFRPQQKRHRQDLQMLDNNTETRVDPNNDNQLSEYYECDQTNDEENIKQKQ